MENFKLLPEPVKSLLLGAQEMCIFRLSPRIGGHTIIGDVTLSEPTKSLLAAAIIEGIAESDDIARCFVPRHALRARRGDEVLEMVICFQCDSIRATFGEEKFTFSTSRRAEPLFDEYFPDSSQPNPEM